MNRAERRKRCLGAVHDLGEPRPRCRHPELRDQGGLAAGFVLGHGLAESGGVALGVKQIVGELKGVAQGGGVSKERGPIPLPGAAENGAGLASEAEQGAGLERLHPGDVVRAETSPLRAEIERLAKRHALPSGCLGQQQDQLGANGGILMGAGIA
jgi:hypothetical protein